MVVRVDEHRVSQKSTPITANREEADDREHLQLLCFKKPQDAKTSLFLSVLLKLQHVSVSGQADAHVHREGPDAPKGQTLEGCHIPGASPESLK